MVDVQAVFLGTESKSDLIKEMGKLCLRRDPNLPKRLTSKQITLAHQHPDIVCAMEAKAKATDRAESQSLSRKIRALKLREERLVFEQALRRRHVLSAQHRKDLSRASSPILTRSIARQEPLVWK